MGKADRALVLYRLWYRTNDVLIIIYVRVKLNRLKVKLNQGPYILTAFSVSWGWLRHRFSWSVKSAELRPFSSVTFVSLHEAKCHAGLSEVELTEPVNSMTKLFVFLTWWSFKPKQLDCGWPQLCQGRLFNWCAYSLRIACFSPNRKFTWIKQLFWNKLTWSFCHENNSVQRTWKVA